jgi:hypothetical protein
LVDCFLIIIKASGSFEALAFFYINERASPVFQTLGILKLAYFLSLLDKFIKKMLIIPI